MSSRTTVVICLASLLAGCRAGSSVHGTADVAQWAPVLKAEAYAGSGDKFNLVGTGGVVDNDALWTFDVSLQFSSAGQRQVKAQTLNLGYWSHEYSGSADLSGVDFANKLLSGPTRTSLKLDLYKFTYGEPQAASGGGSNRTEGTIGLHYLDFSVIAQDLDGATARYSGNAPMFVVGWKVAYADRAMVYFFSVEGMDLNMISLENVKGNVMDYSAGIRWSVGSTAALSIAYREYQAHLNDRGEELNIKLAGAFFSLFIMW